MGVFCNALTCIKQLSVFTTYFGSSFEWLLKTGFTVYLSLKVVLILANSADPDEIQRYAAFHLCLHCLFKYPFRGFQHTKG